MNTGFVLQNEGSSGVVGSIAKIISTLSAAPSSQAQTSDHQVTGCSLHLLCNHHLAHTLCLCWSSNSMHLKQLGIRLASPALTFVCALQVPSSGQTMLIVDFWSPNTNSASAKCSSSQVSILKHVASAAVYALHRSTEL